MRLLVKTEDGKRGQIHLSENATWEELQSQLFIKFGNGPFNISTSFPPKPLIGEPGTLLESSGVREGDTILAKLKDSNKEENVTTKPKPSQTPFMVIREMLDDNSCLFNAIGYVLCDKSRHEAFNLRQLVSNLVLEDSSCNEAVLGMSPAKYASWIMEPNRWGGGIELSLFSKFFTTEIASIDVATGRVDVFGEGMDYLNRVYVLYSGIHYDALAMRLTGDALEASDIVVFDSHDDSILIRALEIAEIAKAEHRYTDLASFALQCDVCSTALKGEREAQAHAEKTGHAKFSEYNN